MLAGRFVKFPLPFRVLKHFTIGRVIRKKIGSFFDLVLNSGWVGWGSRVLNFSVKIIWYVYLVYLTILSILFFPPNLENWSIFQNVLNCRDGSVGSAV